MKKHILFIFLLILTQASTSYAEDYLARKEVQSYLDEVAKTHAYDRTLLNTLFSSIVKQSRAIEALDRPAEAKPWYEYRRIFLTQSRILKGILFWHKNDALIKQVSEHYQVPPEIILALIGVETLYGQITGDFPILDTLVTLGFDYPRRATFFRKELTQFLLLCREEKLSCREVKGSHGGAMGTGQFISSSYRAYAVDFDKDGKRDLWNSKADVLGSVANYIARHGWAPNAPIAERTSLNNDQLSKVLNKQLKPWLSLSDLSNYGVNKDSFQPQENTFTLMGMKTTEQDTDVWAGYHNFYVITRYNHSHRYAMAVYHLSQEISRNRTP